MGSMTGYRQEYRYFRCRHADSGCRHPSQVTVPSRLRNSRKQPARKLSTGKVSVKMRPRKSAEPNPGAACPDHRGTRRRGAGAYRRVVQTP